jgi:uncharacterized protein YcbX
VRLERSQYHARAGNLCGVSEVVGSVQSLHRYPVKSMLGEDLEQVALDRRGVIGDRAYALIDDDTGKVVSIKRPKRWGGMFELAASTRDGTVEVRFPDGTTTAINDASLPGRLSAFFERSVSVAATPPPDATFDEVWMRDLKSGIDPIGSSRIEDGEEMIDNGQMMSVNGNFSNGGPIHIVTTSTTSRFAQVAPDSRFDPKRFRPNIVIETDGDGFVENEWTGRKLTIGAVRMTVLVPTPRCVMTTLPQGELPADRKVLRTIAQHNTVDIGIGVFPCLGIYAVSTEGQIRVGDPVTLA